METTNAYKVGWYGWAVLLLGVLVLLLSGCAGKHMPDGPSANDVQSALSQATPERRASALEALVPQTQISEVRRDLLAGAAYLYLRSDSTTSHDAFVRVAAQLQAAIQDVPLYQTYSDETALAVLGLLGTGEDAKTAASQVANAQDVAPDIRNLCDVPGWRPPMGSFRDRTRIFYERALLSGCISWVKGDFRGAFSAIGKAAEYELTLRDMGAKKDEEPAPTWTSTLGEERAAYAPLAVFESRLQSHNGINLGESIKRLTEEFTVGGVQ